MPQIEFHEDTHTYLVDGMITPSVTHYISEIWMPNKYANVSRKTLNHAAGYGTKVHRLIEYWNDHHETPEDYEKKSYEGIALRRYKQLEEKYQIISEKQEVPVCYIEEGIPLFAGTFDFLGTVGGVHTLADYKTTAAYDGDYLGYQETLYKLAIEQTLGITDIKKTVCIWLPKRDLGNVIDVTLKDPLSLIEDIKKYEEQHNSEG
jgi:hypothetical protein